MFRNIAKKVVGQKPEGMDSRSYRMMVRNVENTLRAWVKGAILGVVCIGLIGLCAWRAHHMPADGYYKPDTINGYHWHSTDGCDICD